MKYILIIALFLPALALAQKNTYKGPGTPYTTGTPNWHPKRATEGELACDSTTGIWWMYSYQTLSWVNSGYKVEETLTTGTPSYTPNKTRSPLAVNSGDSLFHYRAGSWRLINAAGGGGGVSDGDKGDIDVTSSGTVWTVDTSVITNIKIGANAVDSTKIINGGVSVLDIGQHGASSGQVLSWNGTQWAPSTVSVSGDDWGTDVVNHDATLTGDGTAGTPLKVDTSIIATLNDINIILPQVYDLDLITPLPSPVPAEGSIALKDNDVNGTKYLHASNGSVWVDGGLFLDTAAVAYVHLSPNIIDSTKIINGGVSVLDIGQHGAGSGQVLKWNGTQWAPADDEDSGGTVTAADEGLYLDGSTVKLGAPTNSTNHVSGTRYVNMNGSDKVVFNGTSTDRAQFDVPSDYTRRLRLNNPHNAVSSANADTAMVIHNFANFPTSGSVSYNYAMERYLIHNTNPRDSIFWGKQVRVNQTATGPEYTNLFMSDGFNYDIDGNGAELSTYPFYTATKWVDLRAASYDAGYEISTGQGSIFSFIELTSTTSAGDIDMQATTSIEGTVGSGKTFHFNTSGNAYLGNGTGDFTIGVNTSSPTQEMDINGDLRLRGQFYDFANSSGSNGNILTRNASGPTWGTLSISSRLSGNGVSTALDIAQQGATSGQVLAWNGTTWAPASAGTDTNVYTTDGNVQAGGTDITVTDDDPLIFLNTSAAGTNRYIRMVSDNSDDTRFLDFFKAVTPSDSLAIYGYNDAMYIEYEGDGSQDHFTISSNVGMALLADSIITNQPPTRTVLHSLMGMYGTTQSKIVGSSGGQVLAWNSSGYWQLTIPSTYTDEEAQDAVGAMLVDGTTIDLTYTDGTPALTAEVKSNSISNTYLTSGTGGIYKGGGTIPTGTNATAAGTFNIQYLGGNNSYELTTTSTTLYSPDNVSYFFVDNGDISMVTANNTFVLNESSNEANLDVGTFNMMINGGNVVIGGDNTPSELRMRESVTDGSNYTAFKAQAQAADLTYTLPAAYPAANGYVLASTTAGTLSWAAGSVADADYGDITVSSGVWNIDAGVVGNAEISDVNTSKLVSGTFASGFAGTVTASSTVRVNYNGGATGWIVDDANSAASLFSKDGTQFVSADNTLVSIGSGTSKLDYIDGVARLYDSDATQYVAIQTPATGTLTANWTLTLPANDGDANQYLKTDGSGGTSWYDPTSKAHTTETLQSSTFTATKFIINLVDCSAGAITVNPPSSPAVNDRFMVSDATGNAGTNNITIDFDTANQDLYGVEQNYIINADGGGVEFIWVGSTTGWVSNK